MKRPKLPLGDPRWDIARNYCCKQLETMDGSFDAAIRRLGMEKFEELVGEVARVLPVPSRPLTKKERGG